MIQRDQSRYLYWYCKKIFCFILSFALIFLPTASYGGINHLIHIVWDYDTTYPDLAGYRIYQDGVFQTEIADPSVLSADVDVFLEAGTNTFTMTAYDTSGNESGHSAAYTLELPEQDASGNLTPLAQISTSATSGDAPFMIDFDARGALDYDGVIVEYYWDFGDGEVAYGDLVSHLYNVPGEYFATLTVTDNSGAIGYTDVAISVTDPAAEPPLPNQVPVAEIDASVLGGNAPLTVSFDGSFSSDSDGSIVKYNWDFGDGSVASGVAKDHIFGATGEYAVTLTVTDDGGLTSQSQVIISVGETVPVNELPTAAIYSSIDQKIISASWEYTGTDPNLAGFRLYQNDFPICESNDPSAREIVCGLFLETGLMNFSIRSFDTNNLESSDSALFSFDATGHVVTPVEGLIPLTVHFTAKDSADADGTITSYEWNFGDGTIGKGKTVEHTFNNKGVYTVALTVNDNNGATAQATTTVNVVANNTAPVAGNSILAVNENSQATGTLTATDTDGDALTYSIVKGASKGTVTVIDKNSGTYQYAPHTNATGSDSFTFKVSDGIDSSNVATVTVTINTVNNVPVAVNDQTVTSEEKPVTVDVLVNDTDSDNDTLIIESVSTAKNGITQIVNNSVRYTPESDFYGQDSFTYTVSDNNGGTATATVSVTVNNVNDVPVAEDAVFIIDEDSVLSGSLTATDNDADVLTYTIVSNGNLGDVKMTDAANGTFIYTPNADASGKDTFTYKVNDGVADSNISQITVSVNSINDAPIAADDTLIVDEDTTIGIIVLANDVDVEGDILSLQSVGKAAHGAVSVAGDKVIYTPTANFNGDDSFTYTVTDSQATATGTVMVDVLSVNDIPVAKDGALEVQENTPANGNLTATDVDNDTLKYSIVANGTLGTVSINDTAIGSYTYTPNVNATGADTFSFKVNDGTADSDIATIKVNIIPAKNFLVAQDDKATTIESNTVTIAVLQNDFGPERNSLSIISVGQTFNGMVTFAGSNVQYTPQPGFVGVDTFTYTITDGQATAMATVTVNVAESSVDLTITKQIKLSWDYNDVKNEVTGFRLYNNDTVICEASHPDARNMTCDIKLGTSPITFMLKATTLSGEDILIANPITFDPAEYISKWYRLVTFEWDYNNGGTEIKGFKLYNNHKQICETMNPNARKLSCLAPAEEGIAKSYRISAVDIYGRETDPSNSISY